MKWFFNLQHKNDIFIDDWLTFLNIQSREDRKFLIFWSYTTHMTQQSIINAYITLLITSLKVNLKVLPKDISFVASFLLYSSHLIPI